jgi:hypothetical protein
MYSPSRTLRSASGHFLNVPKYNSKTYGSCAFSVASPFLWNSLPHELRNVESLDGFKSKVKTYLFSQAFD